jgi:hypothetical protein
MYPPLPSVYPRALRTDAQVAAPEDEQDGKLRPSSVSSLVFDGLHIAVGTHRGQAKTWKQPRENTDFVQLLVPLQVLFLKSKRNIRIIIRVYKYTIRIFNHV